jgi:hypothetical protein
MPVRNLIGSAVQLGRRVVVTGLGAAGRLRGSQPEEPVQAANGAAATPTAGPVSTGRATPQRKAAAKRTATRKAKKPVRAKKPAAAKRSAAKPRSKPAAAKREPAATANGAGATEKPGAVPTGQTVTSETRPAKPTEPAGSRST